MATYLMLGKYSLEALKAISAERSDKARALIKQNGGELKAGYALLGGAEYGRGVALAKILPTPRCGLH